MRQLSELVGVDLLRRTSAPVFIIFGFLDIDAVRKLWLIYVVTGSVTRYNLLPGIEVIRHGTLINGPGFQ